MDISKRTWFYDELSTLFDKKEGEDKARIRQMQRSAQARTGLGKPWVFTYKNKNFGEVIEIPFQCSDKYRPYAEMDLDNIAGSMKFRRNFKRAHPFLIGPATLESLLDKPVDNYDYISTGKLPFNPLFFEFTDPVSAQIPRIKLSDVSLHAVYLCGSHKGEGMSYVFTSFWKDPKGEILGIDLFMDDPRSTHFRGMVSHISKSNFELDNGKTDKNRYQFVINADEDEIHICRTPKKEAAFASHMHNNPTKLVDFRTIFDESLPLSSLPHNVFSMIPSLSTNLVNYINAHNVEIVTHKRGSPEPSTGTLPHNNEFSIVTVRDDVYHEPKSTHQGKVLTYQIAVRGHNRRLRDEDQQVRKVLWIDSYIKGPEDAPFYDSRHEVTAKKIKAERELFRNYRSR